MKSLHFYCGTLAILLLAALLFLFVPKPQLLWIKSIDFASYNSEEKTAGAPSGGRLEQKLRALYDGVKTFVLFIGYARSGHSLVGAILDSHPEIIIPHEYGALEKWSKYRSATHNTENKSLAKYRLFFDLHALSRIQAMFGNRASLPAHHYTYNVPGGWQGTYKDELKVIGDKRGSAVSGFLVNPENVLVLDEIAKTLQVPLKFIHVIRNPFDNIATKVLRRLGSRDQARDGVYKANNSSVLNYVITQYFKQVYSVQRLHENPNYEVLDVYSYKMVYNPKESLRSLCNFLGVTCYKDFVEPAAEMLFSKPSLTRHSVVWTDELKQRVLREMKKYPFMSPFSFDHD